MKEISVYIHIPFCVRKCSYCDFLSGPADDRMQRSYFESLLTEIEEAKAPYLVNTVFIGGGTPTIVPSSYIKKVLCKLKESFLVREDAEITIECNPGTVDRQKLQEYREAGINRLSIGLQSADNRELKQLGRVHTYEQFLDTYETARSVGFTNINIDLMSSLPEQTFASFQNTLHKAVSLEPEHLSVYSLIIEEGTPFFERQSSLKLPSEETEFEIYRYTREYLKSKNYNRYEISNYAKTGYECRHNIVYWQRGSYLGFGIGAASLMEQEQRNLRFSNVRQLQKYIRILSAADRTENGEKSEFSRTVETDSIEVLTESSRMEEFMFLGLRMIEGVSTKRFLEVFHTAIENIYGDVLRKLEEEKLLVRLSEGEDIRICLTERGLDVSNVVLADFLL